jgi:S1-C subfamily serine protease
MCARTGLNALITQVFVLLGAILASVLTALAQGQPLDELLAGVVYIRTVINPDARTSANLGREREGSGVVIDDNGLVVTVGYLMVEADAAEIRTNDGRTVPANIVGYDYETGFGVLQAMLPLKVRPLPIGKSADVKEGDAVVIASFGGVAAATPAQVVAKKEFAGPWEYLLEDAIFTAPPHARWSGAALISREGQLVGVGSLVLSDAGGSGSPGNMFVPIDRLLPVLPDLIAQGRASSPPRPWIGITTHQIGDRLLVSQVSPAGPAERAGLKRGDIIVGVGGEKPESLADLYRKIWSRGEAGAIVPLEIERDGENRRFDLQSINRLDYLKLRTTY